MVHKIAVLALVLLISAGIVESSTPQSFSLIGLVNRFVTPNGDGKNDMAVFKYINSNDSAGSIRIYELRGRQVATVAIEPGTSFAAWDPQSYANGVYVYVVAVDQMVKSGLLVVVR